MKLNNLLRKHLKDLLLPHGKGITNMIELKHITKTFESGKKKVTALDDVSLTVEKGEIYGVIGYSGAGKSTLVRMANLLEKPTSGDVIIDGDNLVTLSKEALRKKRQRIGMIFQGFNLLKTLTVYQNIAIPLKLTGVADKEIKTRVKKYLDMLGSVIKPTFIRTNSQVVKNNGSQLRVLSHMNRMCC